MLLHQAVDEYLVACGILSPKTSGWYAQKLRTFVAWTTREGLKSPQDLEPKHLQVFQAWLLQQRVCDFSAAHPNKESLMSPFTVRGYGQVAKTFTRWMLEEGYLFSDPFKHVKRPKEPQTVVVPFADGDIHKLLDATKPASPQNLRDRALVLFLLDTGLRASEVVGLRMTHLHLDQDAWVQVDWRSAKGQKSREVALGAEATRALNRYLRLVRHPWTPKEDRVWLNRYGRPLTVSGLGQVFAELNKRAGVSGVRVSPHTFRHTFSANYLKQGGDVFTLSRLLGHGSVGVTERYLRGIHAQDARKLQQQRSSVADTLLRR